MLRLVQCILVAYFIPNSLYLLLSYPDVAHSSLSPLVATVSVGLLLFSLLQFLDSCISDMLQYLFFSDL